jgi:hypothetical protein
MGPVNISGNSNQPGISLVTNGWQERRASSLKQILGLVVLTATCLPVGMVAQTATAAKPDPQPQLEKLEQKLDLLQQEIDTLRLDLKRTAVERQHAKEQSGEVTVTPAAVAAVVVQAEEAKAEAKDTKAKLEELENPLAIHYKKLSIIPGGFLAAESVFRTRNENSDIGSDFGALPFDGTANANLSEFHMSARASRASVMLKTDYNNVKLTGFAEIDWFGDTAANDIKSNSYSPRERQLWVRLDGPHGVSFTAGQMWSLMVRHNQGMETGQEDSAPGDLIEGSFILGHVWERQVGFRLVKNFNNKAWIGIAAENPQTTYSVTNEPLYMFGLSTSTSATTSSSDIIPYSAGVASGFSTDLAPDLIAKANFEPGWGHYELKAIYRFFRTRENGVTYNAYGTGVGWSTKSPILHNLDFVTEGLAGEGIGRYSSGGGPDITLHPDGSPVPIRQLHISSGLEYSPYSRLSMFAYGGNEYYQRAAYVNSNGLGVGYGSPLTNNSQCEVEVPGYDLPTCTAQNRDINQVIGGFWYSFFKGPYGTMKLGVNYEHLHRDTWYAVGGQPYGRDDIVMTSVRFVLP